MKYLFMTADKFPPFRVDVRVLFGEEMTSRRHEIDWILPSAKARSRSGIEPYGNGRAWVGAAASGTSRFAKTMRLLQSFVHDVRVLSLARRNKYDFIQVKDKFVGALFGLLAARLTRTRFIYWLAYPFPEAWLYDAEIGATQHRFVSQIRGLVATFLLYRVILPRADFVFVQSEQMKADIAAKGIGMNRMHAVPMGVSSEVLSAIDQRKAPEVRSPSVIYLGSTLRVRRLEFVIEAFAKVLNSVPEATLYMVGGEHESDIEILRGRARELNIDDRLVFTGNLPREQALRWVHAADVCISPLFPTPILNAASPTKLVEYMALGKPVVANDHPEQTRVIEESGAGLCVPYDVDDFAAAIVEILNDPIKAAEMGKKARDYVEANRSYARIADQVERIYEDIICGESRSNGK